VATTSASEVDVLPTDERPIPARVLARRVLHDASFAVLMAALPRVGAAWRRWAHHRDLTRIIEALPSILPSIQGINLPRQTTWTVLGAEWTRTDLAVVALGPPNGRPLVMLKAAHTSAAVEALGRQQRVVTALLADPRVAGWDRLVPRPVASGIVAGRPFVIEHALAGSNGRQLAYDHRARRRLLRAAAHAIGELHQRTAHRIIVDDVHLMAWVDEPVQLLESHIARSQCAYTGHLDARLRETAADLRRALAGRLVDVSWIHGDLWVGNVLARRDGTDVSGIVDWDAAQPDGLPMHDMLNLLLHTRRVLALEGELTHTLRDVLGGACWTTDEQAVLEAADLPLPRDPAGYHAMLVLHWLRHISRYLSQYPHRGHDSGWITEHIGGILRCL
jgi:aminoglycoside phosphotransferase (APT) family kinase protein